ncbi:MAG: 2-oxo-4-hydroxy-4-carboxy-5-ureidoimidazoline decarboxylase [Saprospiraceae bacterium]|nr:2-oxo-4-hydroxy-4-carboxy-5-ureidoimidazoline decarboxylase [Saprospiraceae bacterium]
MDLKTFNQLDTSDALAVLQKCCGSRTWCEFMDSQRPFEEDERLYAAALHAWYARCHRQDWIEAFSHHPKIGDLESLEQRFGASADLAENEQGQVRSAPREVLEALAEANEVYEEKFGYIFIVCATGKSALEMLLLISERLDNHPDDEIRVAMGEQAKITALRLAKQLRHDVRQVMGRSQITTHVLDTARGTPAAGVPVSLHQHQDGRWPLLTQGVTDTDGRIEDLLPSGQIVQPGPYQLVFKTQAYFERHEQESFYPLVQIRFLISDGRHYHVPLLMNPFGYTTYRGS